MVVAEMVLIAFMALSKASGQAYAMIPLLLSSVLFIYYLRQRHFKVATYLSLETCDKIDSLNSFNKDTTGYLNLCNEKYIQPELLELQRVNEFFKEKSTPQL
jgi:hypothetical protein